MLHLPLVYKANTHFKVNYLHAGFCGILARFLTPWSIIALNMLVDVGARAFKYKKGYHQGTFQSPIEGAEQNGATSKSICNKGTRRPI